MVSILIKWCSRQSMRPAWLVGIVRVREPQAVGYYAISMLSMVTCNMTRLSPFHYKMLHSNAVVHTYHLYIWCYNTGQGDDRDDYGGDDDISASSMQWAWDQQQVVVSKFGSVQFSLTFCWIQNWTLWFSSALYSNSRPEPGVQLLFRFKLGGSNSCLYYCWKSFYQGIFFKWTDTRNKLQQIKYLCHETERWVAPLASLRGVEAEISEVVFQGREW